MWLILYLYVSEIKQTTFSYLGAEEKICYPEV